MTIVAHFLFCTATQKWPPPVLQAILPSDLIGDEI